VTSPSTAAAQDACPLAAWGCRTGLRQPHWRLVSGHATSDGRVEYCRCTCAALVVLHEGEVTAFAPPRRPA
jgi:hypothetical protein